MGLRMDFVNLTGFVAVLRARLHADCTGETFSVSDKDDDAVRYGT